MRIRTSNKNAKRARYQQVYRDAFLYHQERVAKLSRSGRLDKLANSGYVRRRLRSHKLCIERINQVR